MDAPEQMSSDQKLAEALVAEGLLEQAEIDHLWNTQKQQLDAAKEQFAGTLYEVDLEKHAILVKDSRTLELLKEISLKPPNFEPFDADDWDKWGSHLTLVSPEDGTRSASLDWNKNDSYGLIVTADESYLYRPGMEQAEALAATHSVYYGCVYKGQPTAGPLDLYLSRDSKILAVTDRGAGTLTVITTTDHQVKGTVDVRSPGSTRALNLVIDTDRIYITDNQTSILQVLDLNAMELTPHKPGLGMLGNILLAPDGKHLYLITIKPTMALRYIRTDTFEAVKNIKLKGDLFSEDSNDPCDQMVLSPDQSQLLIMTYLNEPRPFTPVISVIETKEIKTVRRYAIKDKKKPLLLAFSHENPMAPHTRDLSQLILDAELITPQDLWDFKRELRLRSSAEEADERPEAKMIEVEHQIIDVGSLEQKNDQLLQTPQKSENIKLGPEAIDEILDILTGTFYQQQGIDISQEPTEMERLQQEAEQIRQHLEDFDSAVVRIERVMKRHILQTVILRESIVLMLDIKASLKEGNIRTPPTHCPNCRQPMLGSWDCDTCGLELESPERLLKQKMASADPLANLPAGSFVIADPLNVRLLELNPFKFIVWKLADDKLECYRPWNTIRLPNRNMLVVDKQANQIFECGPTGKRLWGLDTSLSSNHHLKSPVKVTYYQDDEDFRLLVVDQGNHRVFEIDRDQKIHWSYGVLGIPGDEKEYLRYPSDIQRTHERTYLITDTGNDRVLELEGKNVKWSYGAEQGLKKPVFAQRLFDEHTLIVDAGNYRILELDRSYQLVRECVYYQEEMDPKYKLDTPIQFIRRRNRNILLMDEHRILEIIPEQKTMVWFSLLKELAPQPDYQKYQPPLKQKSSVKSYRQYVLPTQQQEETSDTSEDSKAEMSKMATERLKALIEARKQRAAQETSAVAQTSDKQGNQAVLEEGASVDNIPIYCIDRIHHLLAQIDRQGEVHWHYGSQVEQRLKDPYHMTETENTLLIADTGNNRILEISKMDKSLIREFGANTGLQLAQPRSAVRIHMGKTLISDQRNRRLIDVDAEGHMLWEFKDFKEIASPYYAEELETGHILFVDWGLHMVKEITREGITVWAYGQSRSSGKGLNQLSYPEYATRLFTDTTLIADTRNHRVIEVDAKGQIVWEYGGDENVRLRGPVYCKRLPNGHTLIAHDNYRQIIEVDGTGRLLWSFRLGSTPLVDLEVGEDGAESGEMTYNEAERDLIQKAAERGEQCWEVRVQLMSNCQMKSVRASLIIMNLEKFGSPVKTIPTPEQILADRVGDTIVICLVSSASQQTIHEEAASIAEVAAVEVVGVR